MSRKACHFEETYPGKKWTTIYTGYFFGKNPLVPAEKKLGYIFLQMQAAR